MRIVIVSNKLTPHQVPLCMEFYQTYKESFHFVETMQSDAPLPIGWTKQGNYPFVLDSDYVLNHQSEVAILIMDADIVIIGSAPDSYIIPRLKARKLTFKYAERFYKKGLNWKNITRIIIGTWLHHGRFQKYPLYMLCASAYTAGDCAVFHNYKSRVYKWGYFPFTEYYDIDELLNHKLSNQQNASTVSLLWVGRFLPWKHPEAAVHLADALRKKGLHFHMQMIGNGEMYETIQTMIIVKGLSEYIQLSGALPPKKVRKHMELSDIFVFTSDFYEGWGAVLNEAMNSGCAVVASHAVGAAPFLISDGENGLLYTNGNQEELVTKVSTLISDSEYRSSISKKAYQTIIKDWNAESAAKRIVLLAQNLRQGNTDVLFHDGPCSIADAIANDWYQGH